MSSATSARWLRKVLRLAGIDVSIFSGDSTRGASTSAPAGAGITTNDHDILKGSVQWKNDLGLYCSLVLVMNIGMCDLVILCLVYPLQEF